MAIEVCNCWTDLNDIWLWSYDYRDYSFSVYGTFQPHKYGTEVAYGTNAGLVIVPQPSTTLGASVRYYF
jgi:hypothetical protein